ncbi:hypothetical protein D3C85_1524400 [compost metagenome]
MIGLKPLETGLQIAGDILFRHTGSLLIVMGAFRQDNELIAVTAILHIAADNLFTLTAAVYVGGINGVAADRQKGVEILAYLFIHIMLEVV